MPFDPDAYLKSKMPSPAPTGAPAPTFDPDAYLKAKAGPSLVDQATDLAKSAGRGLLNKAAEAGDYIDRYAGSPVRAAVGSLQASPSLPKAAEAYKNQFGQPTEFAPTPKQLAQTAGVPNTALSEKIPSLYSETGEGWKLKKGGALDPTASGVAGFGLGMATDPTNYIPFDAALSAAGSGIQKAAPKIVETLSGIPSQKTRNYIEDIKGINKKIAENSADIGSASDATKRTINQQITTGKSKLNSAISEELKTLPTEKTISNAPIIQKLESEKAKIRPETNPSAIKEIDKHIDTIKSLADDAGNMNAKDLFDAKQYLQKVGKNAYGEGGQIFLAAPESARAAKGAAAVSRKALNEIAPKIKEANNQLALLHDFEDGLVKNLIKEGGSERDLVIAGSNPSSRQRKSLELLDKILGTDSVKQAKDLSAFSAYASPGLLPMSGHGTTSTSRSLIGAGAGLLAGGGHLNPAFMIPAAAATSPLAAKGLLNVTIPASNFLKDNASLLNRGLIGVRAGGKANSVIGQ